MILRSVHSAVNHTPTHLLKEIILVDDDSDEGTGAADWHRLLGEEGADSQYQEGEMPLPSNVSPGALVSCPWEMLERKRSRQILVHWSASPPGL